MGALPRLNSAHNFASDRYRRICAAILISLLAAAMVGCGPAEPPVAEDRRTDFEGEVVLLNQETRGAVIRHGPIEGWYGAATSEFPVRTLDDFDKLAPGQKVRATLVQEGGKHWIENVTVQANGSG